MAERRAQDWEGILKQLKDPFKPEIVKFRQGGGGLLGYIDARDVMKRLDDVLGVENWRDEYKEVVGGIVCTLYVRNGQDGEWIGKSNGANFTKIEAVKGGISGALKRAAVEWGVGRYLYYLDTKKYGTDSTRWPAYFLPGSVENWWEIAELADELNVGMDDELYVEGAQAAVDAVKAIANAKDLKDLKAITEGLDLATQRILQDDITNKTDELARAKLEK